MNNQTVTVKTQANRRELRVHIADHQPSWKRPMARKGHASIEFSLPLIESKGWLEIDAREFYTSEENRTVEKRAMICLEEPAARALFEMLKSKFELRV